MTEPQVDGATEAEAPTYVRCPFDAFDRNHAGPLDRMHVIAALLADRRKSTIYTQEHPDLPPLALRRVGLIPDLERALHESVRQLIDEARAAGATWEQIGTELGTSRQAANQRFGSGR